MAASPVPPRLVRPVDGGDARITGERRWRALPLVPDADRLIAQVRDVSDLPARRLLAVENVPREDLSPSEGIEAVAELGDAARMDRDIRAAIAEIGPWRMRYDG